jgi:hypothetical protein
MIVGNKAFDNGVICGSENNLVVDASVRAALVERLQACGGHWSASRRSSSRRRRGCRTTKRCACWSSVTTEELSGPTPSLTLGCGTYGRNSITDNVTCRHLLNVKRMALSLG